ncbi:MAG: PspC domain-containing protein [Bacteroidetes bacterium]|nr:PspC domain-containing protein [Bacteroidota bacterium]
MDVNKFLEETTILGVAAWIAERTDTDVKLVRIIFIVVTLVGIGSPIILYLLLYLIKEFLVK